MTFSAITHHEVMTSFAQEGSGQIGHIELADWAHAVVVAPSSADIIAKYVAGIADNPLLAVLLATRASVLLAPAMNVNMWAHPATQENVEVLDDRGVLFCEPGEGPLACGWHGQGRMAEPWDIYHHTLRALSRRDFLGKRVVVVTGPTRESIDPVRFISNRSSGKMGIALAREAFRRGADVEVIHGPIRVKLPSGIQKTAVVSAEEMREATLKAAFPDDGDPPDILVMAAAVSDMRPANPKNEKVKKGDIPSALKLQPNPDILAELGEGRAKAGTNTLLVGFAVETGEVEDLLSEVSRKLQEKQVDVVVGNFADEALGNDTSRVWIVNKSGKETEVATSFKNRIAEKIFNNVRKL